MGTFPLKVICLYFDVTIKISERMKKYYKICNETVISPSNHCKTRR